MSNKQTGMNASNEQEEDTTNPDKKNTNKGSIVFLN